MSCSFFRLERGRGGEGGRGGREGRGEEEWGGEGRGEGTVCQAAGIHFSTVSVHLSLMT